jgi:ABC-type glutathione transport system ATPase component
VGGTVSWPTTSVLRMRRVLACRRTSLPPASRPHPSRPAVELHDVSHIYRSGPHTVAALDGVRIEFPAGRWTAVMGPSGSGKSTLLHCAGGLERPTGGRVLSRATTSRTRHPPS